jgi:DHA1 family multidrug resistance protein-like MFS transporter
LARPRSSLAPAAGVPRTLIAGAVFAVAMAAFSRIPLLPEIGQDLHLTVTEIGLLTTSFGVGRLLMDLPAGRLSAAIPAAAALAAAGATLAVSCALLAVSGSMLEALFASSLIGCATALTNTTGMYAFATATGSEQRGTSMAIFTTALMSGQMVGPAVGGALGALSGWRAAVGVGAGVGVAVALACLPRLRAVRRAPVASPRASAGSNRGGEGERHPIPPRRELIALAATPFATFFGVAGLIQTLIPVIGNDELELSSSTIGFALGVGAAARFLSAWVAGVGSDRLSRKVVLVPSLLLMALGAVVLALSASVVAWMTAIVLLATGSSGISVAAAALADRVSERRLGHELGLFRLLGDFGLLIGPVVAGFLYQLSGQGLAAAASAAVLVTAAGAVALLVREPEPGSMRPGSEVALE